MWNKIMGWARRVASIFGFSEAKRVSADVKVTGKMATAINSWLGVFYNEPEWKGKDAHLTRFAYILTGHMATLATNEIELGTGTGQRAEFIKAQLRENLLSGIRGDIQLAGVGGQVVIKPYVRGGRILCECVMVDRFFPTRIIGGVYEAAFFTDYAKLNGHPVVRIESHDLQPEGVYVHNKAYYETNNGLGAEVSLDEVPEWSGLAPDALIRGADSPLFVCLSMPFSNTVDNTSQLPVSLYANSMDVLREMDRVYSEFLWEVHTGKRRQILDITTIKGKGCGPGNLALATDQYILLDMGSDAKKLYDDYTPDMRVDAYQKAMNVQLRLLESQCGFSAETFSFDVRSGAAKTATEIITEDRTTYNTIKAIQDNGMKQGLYELIRIFDLYCTLYSLAPTGKVEPSVSFGDSIFEDTASEFVRRKALADAGYLRAEKLVGWYFGVSDDEALSTYMPQDNTPDDILLDRR